MVKKKSTSACTPKKNSTPSILNGRLESVAVGKLKPHPSNPRRGNVEAIQESIAANGFYGAVVVQKSTGYILAGNHRYLAAKASGLKALPVFRVDVDDAHARRIMLADNRTNDLASYDDGALAALLKSAKDDGGLLGTGYDDKTLDELIGNLIPAPIAKLDEIAMKNPIICPNCGHEFRP